MMLLIPRLERKDIRLFSKRRKSLRNAKNAAEEAMRGRNFAPSAAGKWPFLWQTVPGAKNQLIILKNSAQSAGRILFLQGKVQSKYFY